MKILAIASAGGHWIQLLRLKPAFKHDELSFVTTNPTFNTMVKDHKFYAVPDANKQSKLKLIKCF